MFLYHSALFLSSIHDELMCSALQTVSNSTILATTTFKNDSHNNISSSGSNNNNYSRNIFEHLFC